MPLPTLPAAPPAPSDWSKIPAAFVENVGQSPRDTRVVSLTMGYELQITEAGARLVAPAGPGVDVAFPGARRSRPALEQPVRARFHFDQGATHRHDVPAFARARQQDLYPGIDAVYYGTQSALEYDFIVHAGADPSQIRVRFSQPAQVDAAGAVTLADWVQRPPVAYQEVDGQRRSVAAHAELEDGMVRFRLGDYDHTRDLVIDPILTRKATLGSGFDVETELAIGPGDTFAVARTVKGRDTALFGDRNIRVAKFEGSTLTFLALINGERRDAVYGLAFDAAGAVYAAGSTESSDLPTNDNAFQKDMSPCVRFPLTAVVNCLLDRRDAFVVKFTATGQREWLTYLGSGRTDLATSIAVASNGRVVVAGDTDGTSFPRKNEFQNCRDSNDEDHPGSAFVSVLNATGTGMVYSTCLHPTSSLGGRYAMARAVAVDTGGNIYVTGETLAGNGEFPTRGGNGTAPFRSNPIAAADVFVAKFNPNLAGDDSLVYSTLLGGAQAEGAFGLALDPLRQACISGHTFSPEFPVRAPLGTLTPLNPHRGQRDWFVTCFNANASDIIFSNLYGGSGDEREPRIARDSADNLWVGGITTSTDLATVKPFQDQTDSNHALLKLAAGTRVTAIFGETAVPFFGIGAAGNTLLVSGANVDRVQECAVAEAGVIFTVGPLLFDANTLRFRQTISLKRRAGRSAEPGLRLVLAGLPNTVQLFNGSGISECFEPGSPFLTLTEPIPGLVDPPLNVTLEFVTVAGSAIVYVPKVAQGAPEV